MTCDECRQMKGGKYTFCWHTVEKFVGCLCGYRCPYAESELESKTAQAWNDYA